MSIKITRIGIHYSAHVTPPHGGGVRWETPEPLDAELLIAELRTRGCHQTDIGDAFYDADPEWLMRLEGGISQ